MLKAINIYSLPFLIETNVSMVKAPNVLQDSHLLPVALKYINAYLGYIQIEHRRPLRIWFSLHYKELKIF